MGIAYCIAGMGCFAALYILVAHSQKKSADAHGLTLMVFVTGLLVSLANAHAFSATMYPGRLIAIGALIGLTAGVGLFGTSLSARAGAPAGVINTVASLALTVPVVLAFIFYRQVPGSVRLAGLLLAVLAILLLQGVTASGASGQVPGQSAGVSRHFLRATYMALMFLGNGFAQFLQTRLHFEGLGALQSSALTMMYLAGGICSAVALLLFRGRVNRGSIRYGCMVGLASFFGNFCTLHALATTPASVVFPIVICGPIVLTVLYSRFVEGYHLKAQQSWGLACGTVAILMLTVR